MNVFKTILCLAIAVSTAGAISTNKEVSTPPLLTSDTTVNDHSQANAGAAAADYPPPTFTKHLPSPVGNDPSQAKTDAKKGEKPTSFSDLVDLNTSHIVITVDKLKEYNAEIDTFFGASPEWTLVVDLGDATRIEDMFGSYLGGPDSYLIPQSVKRLSFKGKFVNTIGKGFLSRRATLTHLDLYGLPNVKEIGDFFLTGCINLTELDLPLQNLSVIGNYFLGGCENLRQLRLPDWIYALGKGFLLNTPKLQSIFVSAGDKKTRFFVNKYFPELSTKLKIIPE